MNIFEEIENMSEQEQEQLLATDFGSLEKEASAELSKMDLVNALYAYGAFVADQEIESTEDLSKEASAEMASAHEEIAQALEESLVESGILDTEDTAELHKEAQATAALMFQGYADQIEKVAADEGKAGKMAKWLHEKKEAIKGAAGKAGEGMKKHKGKFGLGAAALAAGGAAYAYKKHHEKKASELTVSEISDMVAEDQYINSVISEGLNKLAAAGDVAKPGMGAKAKAIWEKAKAGVKSNMGKHPGKYMLGAAALGTAASIGANRAQGKGWRQSLTSSPVAPNYAEANKKEK
jgi:hypothetical protein